MLLRFFKRLTAHHKFKIVMRLTVGGLFIVLGVAGLFLPLLQGILFLAVGIALLADHIPLFARIRDGCYRRFPKLKRLVFRVRARLRLAGQRLRGRVGGGRGSGGAKQTQP